MNTKELQIFVKTVEYKNITRVAEEFGITQPAVSVALKRLEDETGKQLLIRKNKNLVPNAQGMIFYDFAVRFLADLNHTEQGIRDNYYRKEEIVIHIKTPSGKLYSLMDRYLKDHSEASFTLRPYSETSFGFQESFGLTVKLRQDISNEEYTPIDVENLLYVIMRKDHPLSRREQIHFSDIRNEAFVCLRYSSKTGYEQSYTQCLLTGIVPNVTLTVDSTFSKYAAIRRGEWIGLSYNHELSFAERVGDIIAIPMFASVSGKLVCLSWNPSLISDSEQKFVDFVLSEKNKHN